MTAFRFRLEKVLALRRTQLEMEEVKLRQEAAALADLDRQRAQLDAAVAKAEFQVRQWRPVTGADLAAHGGFRVGAAMRQRELARQRAERVRTLSERRTAMLEARRRCRLLERLKERRLAEWTAAADREIEELAAESFLSRWSRERRTSI